MDHVVEFGNRSVVIRDQRKIQPIASTIFDVLQPSLVTVHRIDTQADHFGVPGFEFALEASHLWAGLPSV